MTALTIGLIGMLAFLALVAMRMPIAIAMALAGFAGFSFMVSPQAAMNMVARRYTQFIFLFMALSHVFSGWFLAIIGVGTSCMYYVKS